MLVLEYYHFIEKRPESILCCTIETIMFNDYEGYIFFAGNKDIKKTLQDIVQKTTL